jgi:hypothetical protein
MRSFYELLQISALTMKMEKEIGLLPLYKWNSEMQWEIGMLEILVPCALHFGPPVFAAKQTH